MSRLLLAFMFLPLLAFLIVAQEKQTPPSNPGTSYYAVPMESARKENPVKSSPESLARAKKQYGYDCVMCHGKTGDGKGDVAVDMKLKMNDETQPATLKDRTDGELFYIIKNGKNQMPPEGNRVKDETLWDMVNYVRSFSKPLAASEKPAEEKAATSDKATEEKTPN